LWLHEKNEKKKSKNHGSSQSYFVAGGDQEKGPMNCRKVFNLI
jgi:hypothetical protein